VQGQRQNAKHGHIYGVFGGPTKTSPTGKVVHLIPFRIPKFRVREREGVRAQPILTGYLEMQNRFPTKPKELVVVVKAATPLSSFIASLYFSSFFVCFFALSIRHVS